MWLLLSFSSCLSLRVAVGSVMSYVVFLDKHSAARPSLSPCEIDSPKKSFQALVVHLVFFHSFSPPPVIFSKPQNSPTPGIIVLIQRWHAVNRENSWADSWAPLSSAGMHDTTFTCAQTHTGHTLKPTGKASAGQNSAGHYEAALSVYIHNFLLINVDCSWT